MVAPAGPVCAERYRAGLAILASRYAIVHAYDPCAPPHHALPYLASTDAERAAALNQALRDPSVKAIFCARGGYGSMRILDRLDADAFLRHRPWIVGFSDVTALHSWAGRLGVPTVHGPVVAQLPDLPAEEVESLFCLVEGRASPRLAGLQPVVSGRATGPLSGGNLTLLSHLCGTRYLPDLRGHILLLEDIGEAPYRVDRMLTQLHLSGALDHLAGVLLGSIIDPDSGEEQARVRGHDVLVERLSGLGVPVAAGAPIGHGTHNLAVPLGVTAHLDATQGTLHFEEA